MSFSPQQHPYRPPDFTDNPQYAQHYEPQQLKHSGFGIASFVLALLAGFGTFVVIVVAGVMETQTPGGMDPEGPGVMLIGIGILGAMALHLLGVGLGIGGMVQGNCKRIFAVLGMVFNALVLVGICGIMALGLAVA